MVKRISSLTNNINVLTRKLENLKKEELKSIKTRLYKDEVIVLLKFNDICDVKEEFRLLSSKKSTDLYYVSLGRLDSGKLTVTLELLIKKYIGIFSNPLRIIK